MVFLLELEKDILASQSCRSWAEQVGGGRVHRRKEHRMGKGPALRGMGAGKQGQARHRALSPEQWEPGRDYQQPRDLDFYKRSSDCIRGRAGRDGGGEESQIC